MEIKASSSSGVTMSSNKSRFVGDVSVVNHLSGRDAFNRLRILTDLNMLICQFFTRAPIVCDICFYLIEAPEPANREERKQRDEEKTTKDEEIDLLGHDDDDGGDRYASAASFFILAMPMPMRCPSSTTT